jgi:hypothetical protein
VVLGLGLLVNKENEKKQKKTYFHPPLMATPELRESSSGNGQM